MSCESVAVGWYDVIELPPSKLETVPHYIREVGKFANKKHETERISSKSYGDIT